ncbi:MAG: xanthine dehydrogenase family protein subunit M [Gemmatimonadota bacterium]
MIPAAFDYHAPATLEEAIALLGSLGEEAKILSGGQSLLPLLKLRLGEVSDLVDIGRIEGLEYVREEGDRLLIGGRTTETALERSDVLRDRYPILLDTARVIADPLVRNRATVGGNLAHGDPANDHPATMLALDAEVVATGAAGERVIAVREFFTGFFGTALSTGEILTEIRVPIHQSGDGGAYLKLERKVGDFAAAGAAVQLRLGSDGTVTSAGIGLTNAGNKPVFAGEAGSFLVGQTPSDDAIAEAARLASTAASPSADRRGSVEYKTTMARVLAERAIRTALERAGGN